MTDNFEQLMIFNPETTFKGEDINEYTFLRIVLDGDPMPKQGDRSKIIPRGKGLGKYINGVLYYKLTDLYVLHYQEKDIVDRTTNYKWLIKSQIGPRKPFENRIVISKIDFIFPCPQSFSKKLVQSITDGMIYPKDSRPDCDNLMKFIQDCCNDVVWSDDAKVWWLSNVRKFYGITPRTVIELYAK